MIVKINIVVTRAVVYIYRMVSANVVPDPMTDADIVPSCVEVHIQTRCVAQIVPALVKTEHC